MKTSQLLKRIEKSYRNKKWPEKSHRSGKSEGNNIYFSNEESQKKDNLWHFWALLVFTGKKKQYFTVDDGFGNATALKLQTSFSPWHPAAFKIIFRHLTWTHQKVTTLKQNSCFSETRVFTKPLKLSMGHYTLVHNLSLLVTSLT